MRTTTPTIIPISRALLAFSVMRFLLSRRPPFAKNAKDGAPGGSLHSIQNRAHNSSDYAALDRLSASLMWQVLNDRVSQLGNRERLQPDSPGTSERGKKNSVAAENHVLDARNGRDLKRHARLKRTDMTGMNAQSFAGLQDADHELTGKFKPGSPLPTEPLQQETAAADNACAKRWLEADGNLNLRCRAQKAVAMNHEFASRRNFHRHNVPG